MAVVKVAGRFTCVGWQPANDLTLSRNKLRGKKTVNVKLQKFY